MQGESIEDLDRLEEDHLRAQRGLVPVVGQGAKICYKHIDDLSTHDMNFRIAAERVEVAWLKERMVGR